MAAKKKTKKKVAARSPDYAGGLAAAKAFPLQGKKTAGGKRGGGGGKGGGGGGKNKGQGGGGTFLAAFNPQSEQAIKRITVKALRKGKHQVVKELGTGEDKLKKQYGKGIEAIKTGAATGRQDVKSTVGTAVGGVQKAATTAKGDVTSYNALGRGELRRGEGTGRGDISHGATTGRGDISGARDTSLGYFNPYAAAGKAGSQSYADALGLNGPAGVARAQAQFQTGPGYQFALNQGLQAINRTASSRGELGGGGNEIDTMTYAQGLANQEWNKYLANLQGEQALGATTAGNMADISGNAGTALANISGQEGSNLANISTQAAGDIASNQAATGTSLANIGTNAATTAGGYETAGGEKIADLGETESGRLLNTYSTLGNQDYAHGLNLANIKYGTTTGIAAANSAAQSAQDASSANLWGTVLGVGNTGATLAAGRLPVPATPAGTTPVQPQQPGNLAVVR